MHNELMARRGFLWNAPKGEGVEEVLHDLRSRHSHESLMDQLSTQVLEIGSALSQLSDSYTKSDQRKELADLMRESFLSLQGIMGLLQDWETRTRLTHYLVLIGSLATVEIVEEKSSAPFVFLEAIARRKQRCWVDCFYKAAHGIGTFDTKGQHLRYTLTEDILREALTARDELLHWLDSI